MKKTFIRPIRILLNFKVMITCLFIISFLISVPLYIKYSLRKWTESQKLEVHIDGVHFDWRPWKFPGITFKEVTLKNKGSNPTFTQINVKNVFIVPNYSEFFKSRLKDYSFFLKVKTLKVFLIDEDLIEAETIISNLDYKNSVCEINNITIAPLKIKLAHSASSPDGTNQEKSSAGHLIIYTIKGNGQYRTEERELKIYLQAPPASAEMPEGKTYAIQAEGKIKFLGLMPYQKADILDDPGVRGTITYTIDNFSNLLHHLNQAKFISTMAKNLGTIIGYPVSRVDPFTQQAEIFTNAVSIDMAFKPDGIYIGPMKF